MDVRPNGFAPRQAAVSANNGGSQGQSNMNVRGANQREGVGPSTK